MTTTLSPVLSRLIELRVLEDAQKPHANRWAYYESFRVWAWFKTQSQEEFDEACKAYRDLVGL